MYAKKEYHRYFSGAGYIITGWLALKMANVIDEVPLMPLDDCFIGSVIDFIGKKKFSKKNPKISKNFQIFTKIIRTLIIVR